MAIRKIIDDTNPTIRKISKPVTVFDEKLDMLLDDMIETMHNADGVGIAAVQVGVLKRAVIVEINGLHLELINGKIISSSGKQVNREGCLSVPNRQGYVERAEKITFEAFDRNGYYYQMTVEGPVAMVVGHELDHLDGILYIDKLTEDPDKNKKG